MAQSNILITGATGNVGSELVKKLATANIPFTALVRDAGKTGDLKNFPQASIVMGDLADKVSVVQALQGIEKAFLLTNSSKEAEQLQLNFVDAAWEAGSGVYSTLRQFGVTSIGFPYAFAPPLPILNSPRVMFAAPLHSR